MITTEQYIQRIHDAANYIRERYVMVPQTGIVLGTGLGALVHDIEVDRTIEYKDIPYFPLSTVESHTGRLVFGRLSGRRVVAMQGRFHYYEGYTMKEVTFPIRVLKLLGISELFISNAAGGLDPRFAKSDLMVIADHINLHYENPLTGPNLDQFGVRFPDMSEPYDARFLSLAKQVAEDLKINTVWEGVYVSVPGPNLETKAEYRYLRTIGADAVGMSTVPEVLVARQMDLPVFAVSAITDLCTPGHVVKVTIADVIQAAAKAEPKMTALIKEMLKRI